MQELKIKSFDDKKLHLYIWDDVKKPIGVLQLVHGSCEHAFRYNEFCKFLNKNGWIVVANDHRGHGKTFDSVKNELGFFADNDGWNVLIRDLKVVNDFIYEKFSDLKIVMLGHSMGSFLSRTFLIQYPNAVAGCILSGTAWHSKFVLKFARRIAKRNQKKYGAKHIDSFVWKKSYYPLNKKFKKKDATGVEWLSIDEKNALSFIEDKFCGQIFTSSAFKDMFEGILFNQNPQNISKMNKTIPIKLVAGNDDPVGAYGKGVKKTYLFFKKQGLNVSIKLYPKLRHEILFDIEKEIIQKEVLDFLNSCL